MLLLMILLAVQSGKKKRSQLLLIAIFSQLFFLFFSFEMELLKFNGLFALSFLLSNSIGYTLALLLLAYTKSLFQPYPKPIIKPVHYVIPALHVFTVTLPFALLYGGFISNNSYINFLEQQEIPLSLVENLFMLGYLMMAFRWFQNRFKQAEAYHSNPDVMELTWARHMLLGAIGILSMDTAFSMYELVWTIHWNTTFVSVASSVLVCFYLAYFGIRQQAIFVPYISNPMHEPPESGIQNPIAAKKSALNSLSKTEIDDLKKRLYEVLEGKEVYKQKDLTLADLAMELETSDKKISALMNEHLHTNFYDLVNSHRVASVKEKLVNPAYQKYSILGIAQECGFSSKSGFNRVFKKHTGMSASAYKASVQKAP